MQIGFPKPAREDRVRRQDQAKARVAAYEKDEKAKVVRRDGLHCCRLVPGCEERYRHETAPLDNKGMGGDHGLRSSADRMIRGCYFHHQGNWSLHSRDLRVEFLTDKGTNGPIEVWGRDTTGQWFMVGREARVGVWERD